MCESAVGAHFCGRLHLKNSLDFTRPAGAKERGAHARFLRRPSGCRGRGHQRRERLISPPGWEEIHEQERNGGRRPGLAPGARVGHRLRRGERRPLPEVSERLGGKAEGPPRRDAERRRHAARAAGSPPPRHGATSACGTGQGDPPSGTWGDVGTRHGLRGAPQPRAAGSPCRMQSDVSMGHKLRGAPPPGPRSDIVMRHGLQGAPPGHGATSARGTGCGEPPPGHGEPPQDAKRRQHGARAAGSPRPRPRDAERRRRARAPRPRR